MLNYGLLLFSVSLSTLRNMLNKKVAQTAHTAKQFFLSQTSLFAACCLIVFVLERPDLSAVAPVIWGYAAIYGVLLVASQWMYMLAMRYGRASICTLVYSFGFVLPTVLGVLVWDERMTLFKGAGLALALVVIALSAQVKDDSTQRGGKLYLVALLVAMLTSGGLGVMQKVQQGSAYADQRGAFLLLAFLLATVCSAVACLCAKGKLTKADLPIAGYTAIMGLCFGSVNILNTLLVGRMPSTVFFPTNNIGCVLASAICAVIFFKEKLTPRIVALLVGGFAAVVLLGAF